MELIKYRKTLDVHKNGIQFMLRGFETADNMSRVIEISLMASGDAIDFPLEEVEALIYVTTPNATAPSINKCTIEDNKIVYDVLPIVEEGITTMQVKLIETSPEGAKSVLASPKFAVEVIKSNVDDSSAVQKTTFTALEDAVAKAKSVYDARFLRMELTNDCVFKAYYADGTEYETDILKKLFYNGNVLLSESYAKGGTGVRAGEDTDNSKYYSKVSESEALNAKRIMEDSEDILEEVKLHGVYTAFKVNFETGEVEYVSPSFTFNVNIDSGELDAIGQAHSFDDEVGLLVNEWLIQKGADIEALKETAKNHGEQIEQLNEDFDSHKEEITPIAKGGTGADNSEEAKANLGIVDSFEVKITSGGKTSPNGTDISCDKTFAEINEAISSGKRVYARAYRKDGTRFYESEIPLVKVSTSELVFVCVFPTIFGGGYETIIGSMSCFEIKADSSVELVNSRIGNACIKHGTYSGVAQYASEIGKEHPNELHFDFNVKFLYITHGSRSLILSAHDVSGEYGDGILNTDAYSFTVDGISGEVSSPERITIVKEFDGEYVRWYASSGLSTVEVLPKHQFNEIGKVYDYIAIGEGAVR